MHILSNILPLLRREVNILLHHPIYIICDIVLPLLITLFFTSLMNEGQPVNMPIGIVDNDNTTVTRKLSRMIDGFQSSHVIAHYPTIEEARRAIQRNDIYGFIHFPEQLTQDLLSARQPKMGIYFTYTSYTAGALLYKEMKTLCNLAGAAVAQSTLQAKGATQKQIMFFLQPITLDTHNIGNPLINYNAYLSPMLVPACILLFVFLMTVYSIGTELKFNTQKEWLAMANENMPLAIATKLLPQTFIFTGTMLFSLFYMFGVLEFPTAGSFWHVLFIGFISVIAAQGFAIFIFGIIPSLRMALSICSLWGVLSFSMVGTAYPISAMDAPLQALTWLFPLRHYYIIYEFCILNNFPLSNVWPHIIAMATFTILPIFVAKRIHKALHEFEYQP